MSAPAAIHPTYHSDSSVITPPPQPGSPNKTASLRGHAHQCDVLLNVAGADHQVTLVLTYFSI